MSNVGSPLNNIGAQISPFNPAAGDTAAAAFQRLAASYPTNRNATATAQIYSGQPAQKAQPAPAQPQYSMAPNYMNQIAGMLNVQPQQASVQGVVPNQVPLPTFNQLQQMMGQSFNDYRTTSPMASNTMFQDAMRAKQMQSLVGQYYNVIPQYMAAQLGAQKASAAEGQQLANLATAGYGQNVSNSLQGASVLERLLLGLG